MDYYANKVNAHFSICILSSGCKILVLEKEFYDTVSWLKFKKQWLLKSSFTLVIRYSKIHWEKNAIKSIAFLLNACILLRPWINRTTWLNYTFICFFFIFAQFSLKRSWQTSLIIFCSIFQIFRKTFCKIRKLPQTNFHRNLVAWSGWSMALIHKNILQEPMNMLLIL